MLRKPATILLHFALLTILLGACVTHFFGEQGEIHLRADKAETISIQRLTTNDKLQITLFLWDFQVVEDPQTHAPVDYITDLRLLDRSKSNRPKAGLTAQRSNSETVQQRSGLLVESGIIQMNKPLKYKHFRFCQSDYDSDEQGVVLTYNYDPWGIGITYTGYALLLIAMIAFFFQRRTYFRAMLKKITSNSNNSCGLTAERSNRLVKAGLTALAVIVIILSAIMTIVVTPKPPLQPVLQTPLLGIHVSIIMLAYTLFVIIAINGIVGLCSKKLSTFNYQLSTILLYPAEFCLMAGIFIGAVWANMSWGRYWGWDPKETWALITMLVYALLLHFPWLKRLTAKRSYSETVLQAKPVQQRSCHVVYHILSIIAFFFVLFTYFGVSYLLGGLHSYA